MRQNQQEISASGIIVILLVLINAIVLERAFISDTRWYQLTFITVPLLVVSIVFRKKW